MTEQNDPNDEDADLAPESPKSDPVPAGEPAETDPESETAAGTEPA